MTFWPFSVIRARGLMVARVVRSRITVRAVTDLPEPLSPTSAMVSPLCSWNETSRTPSTIPPSTLKYTPILRASRMSSRPCVPRSWRSVGAKLCAGSVIRGSVGIDGVAQAVAERVEGEDGDQHEDDRREDPGIGTDHREGARILEHQTPRDKRRLHRKAQEPQEALEQHHGRNGDRRCDN